MEVLSEVEMRAALLLLTHALLVVLVVSTTYYRCSNPIAIFLYIYPSILFIIYIYKQPRLVLRARSYAFTNGHWPHINGNIFFLNSVKSPSTPPPPLHHDQLKTNILQFIWRFEINSFQGDAFRSVPYSRHIANIYVKPANKLYKLYFS